MTSVYKSLNSQFLVAVLEDVDTWLLPISCSPIILDRWESTSFVLLWIFVSKSYYFTSVLLYFMIYPGTHEPLLIPLNPHLSATL